MLHIKEIKKACLTGRIIISEHARQRLEKRGYWEEDVRKCILTGFIKGRQIYNRKPAILIAGNDLDELPIVVVVGVSEEYRNYYNIITVMPPIDRDRFDRVI